MTIAIKPAVHFIKDLRIRKQKRKYFLSRPFTVPLPHRFLQLTVGFGKGGWPAKDGVAFLPLEWVIVNVFGNTQGSRRLRLLRWLQAQSSREVKSSRHRLLPAFKISFSPLKPLSSFSQIRSTPTSSQPDPIAIAAAWCCVMVVPMTAKQGLAMASAASASASDLDTQR